ncbi:MAG TPA: alcohol dehydrogenase catalytic domain-containing protein [Pyrinomonadaceae bacterium]|nr:alcohol dehydrogenase catalytic domain-containing protein [Pyrinomonadaceae bacterium]
MSTLTGTNGKVFSPVTTAATMRACVLVDTARLEVRDVACPQISPHDVLIRVAAVGLCGTDSHIFAGHANYNTDEHGQPIPLSAQPQILGHEISGQVEEVGSEVRDLRVGDHVVVDQGLNCVSERRAELCEYCRTGDSHQCEFYREHGITGLPGGLAEFIVVPAVNAVGVSSELEATLTALVEPLGCIIHSSAVVSQARTRYSINAGQAERRVRSVLICGAGPAGLLFTQYLRGVLGYDGLLLVSEPNEGKRKLAERFCADEALDPGACDLVEEVLGRTKGRGVEYLIEASGAGKVFSAIPGLVRKQATVLLYGHGHAGVDLSVLNNVMFREPRLVTPVGASGGFDRDGRPSVYVQALDLIESGRIDVASLITHRYSSLDEVQGALANDIHTPDYIKGVVTL